MSKSTQRMPEIGEAENARLVWPHDNSAVVLASLWSWRLPVSARVSYECVRFVLSYLLDRYGHLDY